MTEQPRDWDKELAAIDRAMEREGTASPAPRVPAPAPSPGRPPAAAPSRRSAAFAWLVVLLAVVLGAGLPLWPYATTCGLQLAFYLGAIVLTLVVGLWSAVIAWRARTGAAQGLGLLVVGWTLALAAAAVLPRIGYARESLPWLCPDAPPPAPTVPAPAPTAPQSQPSAPAPSTEAPAPAEEPGTSPPL